MIVAAHQPHYLPWLRYIHKMALCDVFVILDDVQFTKNGWQNRNKIKGAQGPVLLTVPVRDASFKPIRQIEINVQVPWREKHWKSIVYNYTKAPFFRQYGDLLADVYAQDWTRLFDLNLGLINVLREAFGITCTVVLSSSLGIEGRSSERLLKICRRLGATHYLTGAYAASNHLEMEGFAQSGIALLMQPWECPTYQQQFPGIGFIAELSAIDLLFNEGPRSRDIFISSSGSPVMVRPSTQRANALI